MDVGARVRGRGYDAAHQRVRVQRDDEGDVGVPTSQGGHRCGYGPQRLAPGLAAVHRDQHHRPALGEHLAEGARRRRV